MGWSSLMVGFTDVPQLNSRNDDDFYDRLNHRWTTAQLVLFAILVSTKQYVGDPIHCWCPKHFHSSWVKYSNSYCWVKNTYYLPYDMDIPRYQQDRTMWPVIYYQWVPLILLSQAIVFYLPVTLWRALNTRTGLDVNDMVETSEKLQTAVDQESRSRLLQFLTIQMHRYITRGRRPLKNEKLCLEGCRLNVRCISSYLCCCFMGKRFGNYMIILYMFYKLISLGNIAAQLFLLDRFLGYSFCTYGYDVIVAIIKGEDWTDGPRFPKVTLCDVEIRRLGNLNRYTLQCVLNINLFNEKIYLFLWFWFVILGVLSVWGFISWMSRIAVPGEASRYVRRCLVGHGRFKVNRISSKNRKLLNMFVYDYLKQDGVFVLRLIDLNTNKVTLNEYTDALWEHFKEYSKRRRRTVTSMQSIEEGEMP